MARSFWTMETLAMANTLRLATRKGLLSFDLTDADGPRLARVSFEAEPVTISLRDPRDGTLYAALRHGHFGVKLHRSDDDGATWTEITTPSFPLADSEGDDPADAPSVDMIWCLEVADPEAPGSLWAGTLPGALFRSDDRGETWTLNQGLWTVPERSMWFGGGYDQPGIHSILVDPRDAKKILLAISCGGVWHSADAGATWQLWGEGLRAEYLPPEQAGDKATQDPHRLVRSPSRPNVVWCQHHNGIFRSDDAGRTWREIHGADPAFGFAVAVHPEDPETVWFVPGVKDEHRLPKDRRMVVHRTRDGGQSFDVLANGLPDPSFDLVFRHALAVDATGRRLAMGSTTGNLWLTSDGGESWQLLSAHLPTVYQVTFE